LFLRILIHGINFSPELTGIGKYTGEMAEWLAAHGHEVRVVTAPPYYPQWKVADGFVNGWSKQVQGEKQFQAPRLKEQGNLNSLESCALKLLPVVVYRCPLWVPEKPSGLKRVVHLASFALSSLPVMLLQVFWRPDVVWVVEPPLFCSPQAWLVARLSGGKAWLHIQDYEVDAAFELGLLKGAVLRGLVAAGERWLMRRFDRISTISQQMLALALAKGVVPERAVLFPNWVEITTGSRIEDRGECAYRAELGISADALVALYSGNMGGKQGLEILAQVANLSIHQPEIVFVFCGNGAGKAELVELCVGLSNVRFMDLQPMERLGELLEFADIHLLPQRAGAADLVMPSKLTGMLASARPVVATAHAGTELARVVEGCGLVVEPEQPDEFYHAINMLASDVALRSKLDAAGRAYAEAHLDRDAVLGRFEAELEKLTGKKLRGKCKASSHKPTGGYPRN
jgi:colanic acid biosynthesis glycosyl transferase WcaI